MVVVEVGQDVKMVNIGMTGDEALEISIVPEGDGIAYILIIRKASLGAASTNGPEHSWP